MVSGSLASGSLTSSLSDPAASLPGSLSVRAIPLCRPYYFMKSVILLIGNIIFVWRHIIMQFLMSSNFIFGFRNEIDIKYIFNFETHANFSAVTNFYTLPNCGGKKYRFYTVPVTNNIASQKNVIKL